MKRTTLAPIVAAAIVVATMLGVALLSCATAGFYDLSDSGVVKVCRTGPLVFCDSGVLSGRACVVTANESDPLLKQLSPGQYQDKCVVNYLAPGHDLNGDCILNSVCKCEDPSDDAAAPPAWNCTQ